MIKRESFAFVYNILDFKLLKCNFVFIRLETTMTKSSAIETKGIAFLQI